MLARGVAVTYETRVSSRVCLLFVCVVD
jgi:hypothetical protein